MMTTMLLSQPQQVRDGADLAAKAKPGDLIPLGMARALGGEEAVVALQMLLLARGLDLLFAVDGFIVVDSA